MLPPLLQISHLSIHFSGQQGETPAVTDLSLQIKRGEIVALVGESGSGKSVTALSLLQLLPSPPAIYTSGELLFSPSGGPAVDLLKMNADRMQQVRGNQIAMIFQEPMSSLNPVFSCGSQVMEAIRLHKEITRSLAKQEAMELFERMQLPDPAAVFHRYPHQLSGGQKQRVMIAMAMSCQPSLLICDEPTTALDVTVQKTILRLIKDLQQKQGMGVLFITHDLGVVAEIADRALVMYKGRMVEEGPVKEIFSAPRHPYTRGLLLCRPALYRKGQRLPLAGDMRSAPHPAKTAPPYLLEHPASTAGLPPENPLLNSPRNPVFSVRGLSVSFPSRKGLLGRPARYTRAVDDISFDIYEGETLGLVGESGCGKTTLGRALLQLVRPGAGKILYRGKDMASCSPGALKHLRRDIQLIFQDPFSSLNPRMTVGAAIEEPMKVHRIITSAGERRKKVRELLEKVGLTPEQASRYPHEFSGGQRQRIVIARALAVNPSFLVCDESVSALDVSVQAQVLNLLNDLKTAYGFTILFISHDLSVVRYFCDRICVMNRGRMEEMGEAEDICLRPASAYTRVLLDAIPRGL